MRSIESASGYFGWPRRASSRRESLALGTDHLHLSSSNDSGDEASVTAPSTPGVVRRAVTRRGNLLPKTKGFARIRAALLEESAPVDTEVRREAETIRQVRERDEITDLGKSTTVSSPGLLPTVPGILDTLEDIPEDSTMGIDSGPGNVKPGPNLNFGRHASRNSAGLNWWNKFDKDLRTPPPPTFPLVARAWAETSTWILRQSLSWLTAVMVLSYPPLIPLPTNLQLLHLSVHNSPIVSQSPGQRDTTGWGQPPKHTRENSTAGTIEPVRSNSGGSSTSLASTATLGPKRVGLQGMTDTNDGLMKMSIE
ncbi:hypothetical protein H2203_007919 [Taxawa tesnikishii (nom. ined.)]|nr:hypothetical protein H2203_007919 [Dothideales sp. JES 119]